MGALILLVVLLFLLHFLNSSGIWEQDLLLQMIITWIVSYAFWFPISGYFATSIAGLIPVAILVIVICLVAMFVGDILGSALKD